MIQITNLSKEFFNKEGNLQILKDISFTINNDEFVTIFGPNGCGKTTLLKILAGLTSLTSGTIQYECKPSI